MHEDKWQVWCDWAAARGIRVPTDPGFSQARQRVWESSEFVALSCVRQPEIFAELLESGDLDRPFPADILTRQLEKVLDGIAESGALSRQLRRFRRRQMIRIIWRDIGLQVPLEETLSDLSDLAEACISQALGWLEKALRAEWGTPRDPRGNPQSLVVLAMGKLGARELNLSSDVDLIFTYPSAGETDGKRPRTNEQFFTRLARQLIQVLEAPTSEGFVFRVDTRLRPFGSAGPLVISFGAMEDYYQSQAREWERYAMIKARVVAGPPADGQQLMKLLQPFIYRRYLDFGAVEALRSLKQRISQEVQRKGLEDHIKLGPGGIREIEFIGQTFQLIRGGREPALQVRPIRTVLRVLAEKGWLSGTVAKQLDEAYVFLRRLENRLQAWRDEQTHRLPQEEAGRWRVARAMGYADWPSFAQVLAAHRQRVQAQFDALFGEPDPQESPWVQVWQGTEAALPILTSGGFQAPEEALQQLTRFREGSQCRHLSARGRERLDRLMPQVLAAVGRTEAPDRVLKRILPPLESIVRRTAYLAMLLEQPQILTQFTQLTAKSPWISQQIARHPLLLDELLDPRRLYAPLRRADLQEELRALLAAVDPEDLEQQMERLRQFAQGNRLRVAAADLVGAIPLMVVSDYLTEIAEVTLQGVIDPAEAYLREKYGAPGGVPPDRSDFLIVGYGKLGGIELSYGSDLDLVFLQGRPGHQSMTQGKRSIANDQFYIRLGQRIVHMLTTRTPSGQLYEVDMRLRPDGNKGLLVRALSAFAQYEREEAWTWEHQALVRARPVAGDPTLFAPFQAIRREILCRARDPKQLQTEVRTMREKMRTNLDRSDGERFDLKQGVGGIVDIEFLVQYAVLRWAHRHPALTRWTDNIRLLDTLESLDLLPDRSAEALREAYKALRAAYHRSALQEQPSFVPAHQLRKERQQVQRLWQRLMQA